MMPIVYSSGSMGERKLCHVCGGQATRMITSGSKTYGYSCVKCYDELLHRLGLDGTPHESPSVSNGSGYMKGGSSLPITFPEQAAYSVAEAERIIRESWLRNNPDANGMCPAEPV